MIYKNKLIINGVLSEIYESPADRKHSHILVFIKDKQDIMLLMTCDRDIIPANALKKHIYIEGYIKGTYTTINDQKIYKQTLCVTKINIATTALEDIYDIKGRFFRPMNYSLYIAGELKHERTDGNWKRYVVETTEKNGEKTRINLSWRMLDKHPVFSLGDNVCAICTISTPERFVGGKKKRYTDLGIYDMASSLNFDSAAITDALLNRT